MRVNVAASACGQSSRSSLPVPVTVQIRPSRGMPGEHSYLTDSRTLLRMLTSKTDLSGDVLDGFEMQLRIALNARLSGVELSEHTLREIGYFID